MLSCTVTTTHITSKSRRTSEIVTHVTHSTCFTYTFTKTCIINKSRRAARVTDPLLSGGGESLESLSPFFRLTPQSTCCHMMCVFPGIMPISPQVPQSGEWRGDSPSPLTFLTAHPESYNEPRREKTYKPQILSFVPLIRVICVICGFVLVDDIRFFE